MYFLFLPTNVLCNIQVEMCKTGSDCNGLMTERLETEGDKPEIKIKELASRSTYYLRVAAFNHGGNFLKVFPIYLSRLYFGQRNHLAFLESSCHPFTTLGGISPHYPFNAEHQGGKL